MITKLKTRLNIFKLLSLFFASVIFRANSKSSTFFIILQKINHRLTNGPLSFIRTKRKTKKYDWSIMSKFDLIVPIGSSCITAESVQKRGLRQFSLPFDWIKVLSLEQATDFLQNRFDGFLQAEDFEPYRESAKVFGYRNRRSGLIFLHDFGPEGNFAAAFPEVQAKYARRIARLYAKIAAAEHILFIHIQSQNDNQALPLADQTQKLRQLFPDKNLTLLHIKLSNDNAATFYCRNPEAPSSFTAFRDHRVKEDISDFKQFIPSVELILDEFLDVSLAYRAWRRCRKLLKLPIILLSLFIPSKKLRHRLKFFVKKY